MGPLAALAKVIDNTTVGGKLTDAHSEPDVRDITAHPMLEKSENQPKQIQTVISRNLIVSVKAK